MDNVDTSIKIDMMVMSPKQHRNIPNDALGLSEKTILDTDLKTTAVKQLVEVKECSICLIEFVQDEWVIKLRCNETHVFHEDCVSEWIKKSNFTCPLCRDPIISNPEVIEQI